MRWLPANTFLLLLGTVAPVLGQSAPAPGPSMLWEAGASAAGGNGGRRWVGSPKARGFLLGAVIGGALAGFAGNRICRSYSATTADRCLGDTLWWAVGGAILGGLIGASGAERHEE